jgi:hypothetical protein
MPSLHVSRAKRNHISTTLEPSNTPAEVPVPPRVPATVAGAHLHRRYWVLASLADLVASLAGLGLEEAR